MSEFSWGTQVAEDARPEQQSEAQAKEPETLALSVDEFAALEERILRAVNLVKRERLTRAEAEERAVQAEAKLQEQMPVADQLRKESEQLQTEVNGLRAERDQVRQRVERLLSQLDALEL
jgi:uncharacterized coiled-coil DUF342 family protein